MDLASRISGLMNQRGWTYYRLGKESGVHISTINNILSGVTKNTSKANLEKIAKAFNITVSELIGEKEQEINIEYLEIAKSAQDKKIPPEKLRQLIDLLGD